MISTSIIQERIDFLQSQIQSLDHYLPETYQFLIAEMDSQQVLLKCLEVQDHFAVIDSIDGALSPCGDSQGT